MNVRFKQIFLVLLLITSVAVAHVSACACSHHVEQQAIEQADCHSQHEMPKATETVADANICDKDCVCSVQQPSPYAASKAASKEFRASDEIATPSQFLANIEFVARSVSADPSPIFISTTIHSATLTSLLPARAPPRL